MLIILIVIKVNSNFLGYVLAELPLEALNQSPYLGQILAKIGKLSNPQLLQATNFTRVQEIAKLAVTKVRGLILIGYCNNVLS